MSKRTRQERPVNGSTRGRKPLPEAQRRTRRAELLMTTSEEAWLLPKVADAGMTASEFLRELVFAAKVESREDLTKATVARRAVWHRMASDLAHRTRSP